MKLPAAIGLLAALCAAPARCQQADAVARGDVVQGIRASGIVEARDPFRLKSTIEGRVDKVWTATGVWVAADQDLGLLVSKEYAAMTDANATTDEATLAQRWENIYKPTHLRCPKTCFILKTFARSRQWVKPFALIFEAATRMQISGQVGPQDAPLARDGLVLRYWPVGDSTRRFQATIAHYTPAQGAFTMDADMSPNRFLPPGAKWEGFVVLAEKADVLRVPTPALLRLGKKVYLPVEVMIGLASPEWTEIIQGAVEKHPILIPSDSQLQSAQRYQGEALCPPCAQAAPRQAPSVPEAAWPAPEPETQPSTTPKAQPAARPEPQPTAQPAQPPAPKAEYQPSQRRINELREPDAKGEDPYSE